MKTAGFEPQYGQSQGGIVNIITQSGGNEYHGAIYGFATPKAFEATRNQPDDAPRRNTAGKLLHQESYDVGADLGGYVPGARDKLFFFGSFNPSVRRDIVRGAEANPLSTTDSGLRIIRGAEFASRTRTYNYAAKGEYLINPNHQITFSIFGDPSKTNKSTWGSLTIDNTTADSILDYGTRNMSLRYNGTLSSTLTFNASLGFGKSRFDETGFDNFNLITDRRGSDQLMFRRLQASFRRAATSTRSATASLSLRSPGLDARTSTSPRPTPCGASIHSAWVTRSSVALTKERVTEVVQSERFRRETALPQDKKRTFSCACVSRTSATVGGVPNTLPLFQ